jgi:excisionase family DNA binding protein
MNTGHQERLISVEELADRLDLGRSTLYRLIASGQIGPQSVKLGGAVKFRAAEVDAWISSGCPCRRKWQEQTTS